MTRSRSPNYPAIGLQEAVELADKLWKTQKRSAIPLGQAVKNMGFKGPTGITGTKVSALRKFGLIEAAAKDVQLTERAIHIVAPLRPHERAQALREAAESIELFKELRAKFEGVNDDTLRSALERQGFSSPGATQAIMAYRATMTFASLNAEGFASEDPLEDEDEHDEEREEGANSSARRNPKRSRRGEQGMTVLSFQISDRLVEVAVDGGPLTKDEISTLKEYLAIQERIAPPTNTSAREDDEPEGDES